MDLLVLRDRIRTKATSVGLTYTEIETLADVNEILNQNMPCLLWNYSGESNNYSSSATEMTLDIYLLTNFHDSQKTETSEYQRDFIVTEKEKLRKYYIDFLKVLGFECDENYLEVLRDEQIPLSERISIEGFLTFNMRVTVNTSRDYCLEIEEC